ncbi:hypothetical protein M011DRAFT_471171 [Sporormia fimetaria CBS 119925]|uniref:Uncharacterized protein n=1 Tax=Sporormia fimetaria CBS 119925 TaxID=1340428 RepID=A0A6A6V0S5_9PLEO|nr:hypothetical protein M011DRAFT_471171 [Sporormia fimetaria CBS 119925]
MARCGRQCAQRGVHQPGSRTVTWPGKPLLLPPANQLVSRTPSKALSDDWSAHSTVPGTVGSPANADTRTSMLYMSSQGLLIPRESSPRA